MTSNQPPRRKWAEIQAEIFVNTARDLGCEDSQERFDRLLRKLLPEITPDSLREETLEFQAAPRAFPRRDAS